MKKLICMVLMSGFVCAGQLNGLCAEADGVNLLPNPGFEEGDKLPTGWKTWQDENGNCSTFIWDNATAHSGQRSLYICNTDKEGVPAWIASCDLKPDTSYRFTAWIKIQKEKDSKGVVYIRARGRGKEMVKKWESTSEAKADTGGQWQQLKWEFKTPSGLERTDIWLWSLKGNGDKVWFDDVELKEIPK